MAHLFGLPDSDYDTFAAWVDDLGQFFNYDLKNPAVSSRVHSAIEALRGYLAQIAGSPARPEGSDLMHRLLEPREDGTLSLDEAVVAGTNLLAAGTDTVSSSVRIACYLLATHPEQFELLRADPGLVPGAVEELLRFEPASPLHVRRAVTDVEVEGCPVHAGEMVMLAPIMADRDPAVWDRPDELDVTRQGAPRTQIFGGGPHMCLGAALARVELQEFLAVLVTRARRLVAHGTPRFQPFQTLRQIHDVDVDIIPAD
jgi:cytochrome P450